MKRTRTAQELNVAGRGHLSGLVGVEIVTVAEDGAVHSRLALRPALIARPFAKSFAAVIECTCDAGGLRLFLLLPLPTGGLDRLSTPS